MGLLEHAHDTFAPFTMKNFPLTVTHPRKIQGIIRSVLDDFVIVSCIDFLISILFHYLIFTGDFLVGNAIYVLQTAQAILHAPGAARRVTRVRQQLNLTLVALVRQ